MMLQDADRLAWRVIGTTVGGNSQEQQPNREVLRWLFPSEATGVLTIAAGRKHARHFRSHEGARLVADTTLLVLQDYLAQQGEDLEALRSALLLDLPTQIAQRWRQSIASTLLYAPLTAEELLRLEQQEGLAARQEIESQPLLAYDTTFLVVLVTPTELLTVRLGDGELLMVGENGQVTNFFSRSAQESSVGTSSLCNAEASQHMQSVVQTLRGQPPALLILATAGYPRTFHNEAAFMLIGTNLLTLLRADGLERGQSSIEKWLTEAAQEGQGEDMTFAVLCRMEALQPSTVSAAAVVALPPVLLPGTPEDVVPPENTGPVPEKPAEPLPVKAESPVDEVEARHERFAPPAYRPRSSRILVATAQCRRTKRLFQLHIEARGYGRWAVMKASTTAEIPGRSNAETQHAFSGELSVDALYTGCPYCQAERLAQCSCGQAACWDGSRRAITCPWCAVIGEGTSHIEELPAHEDR